METGKDSEHHRLSLFAVMQGKPYNQSVKVTVTEDEEPAIWAWLAGRAETMLAMWEPVPGAGRTSRKPRSQ